MHSFDDDCSNTEANADNGWIDPKQLPVRTHIYCTPHLDNSLAGKAICNEYFNIFIIEMDLWSLL